MDFSIFTNMVNYPHSQFSNIFITAKRNPILLTYHSFQLSTSSALNNY